MIVKAQYKEFEPGEFIATEERSLEETMALVRAFPWEAQRDHLKVSLTNPSVCVEDGNGNFLKLALYYGGKFVLHYFNKQHQLFTKSLNGFRDAEVYFRLFFGGPPFDTTDFRLEPTWFQHNLVHFESSDFHYEATRTRILTYLVGTSGFNFLLTLFISVLILLPSNRAPIVVMFAVIFVFGGGLNLILFFNYYRYSKGKLLIISRGNPQFWYGDSASPEPYSKEDIVSVTDHCAARNTRNPIGGFSWVEILLANGKILALPNLLINKTDLENKLYQHPAQIKEGGFPFISPSASSPS